MDVVRKLHTAGYVSLIAKLPQWMTVKLQPKKFSKKILKMLLQNFKEQNKKNTHKKKHIYVYDIKLIG